MYYIFFENLENFPIKVRCYKHNTDSWSSFKKSYLKMADEKYALVEKIIKDVHNVLSKTAEL